ncbi:MAG: DUF92 domain-containing protein [Terracidiphilus sp.]|jgi:uncharacterized protein (TIGR00297 family)
MKPTPNSSLAWQSKLVLLAVLPVAAIDVVLQCHFFVRNQPSIAIWTLGLSLLLGLVVLKLRAATPAAAATGLVITASLMFSTVTFPYQPWHTAMVPVLAVSLLAYFATKLGRAKKERLGTAESRKGRAASQVAANLGVAAIMLGFNVQSWLIDSHWFSPSGLAPIPIFAVGLAALAEAAADTVSSEIGQVLGGRPRMITTLHTTEPGTDGAISFAGTLAGFVAAIIVAVSGTLAFRGDLALFWISSAAAVFGLLFDSLLGATLERRRWLNNDAVNFLSTASAAAFALAILAILPHPGVG